MPRCSKKKRDGEACRAWAVRGTDPPACSAHAGRNTGAGAPQGNQNALKHGIYGRFYTVEEIADLVASAMDADVTDELAAARVGARRALARLEEELSLKDFVSVLRAFNESLTVVARLVRTQRAITGESGDGIAGAIAQALDEIGTELGIEL